MVGSDRVVEDVQAVSLLRLEQPAQPPSAAHSELQQKLTLMTAMSDMRDLPWDAVAVGSCHAVLRSLNARFRRRNGPSKPELWPIFKALL